MPRKRHSFCPNENEQIQCDPLFLTIDDERITRHSFVRLPMNELKRSGASPRKLLAVQIEVSGQVEEPRAVLGTRRAVRADCPRPQIEIKNLDRPPTANPLEPGYGSKIYEILKILNGNTCLHVTSRESVERS